MECGQGHPPYSIDCDPQWTDNQIVIMNGMENPPRRGMNEDVKRVLGILALVSLLAAGCSGSGKPAATPTTSSTDGPSVSALMVCSTEAQADIEEAIGVRVSSSPTSTFADHLFTCDYPYPGGTIVLTVKDLPDKASTDAYYSRALSTVSKPRELPGLGEGAFSDDKGTVYVRKDYKVLRVDATALPVSFGQPPHTRDVIAVAVAAALMLCWTGA
jgi:hypothetical protein